MNVCHWSLVGNATRVPGYPKTRVNPPVFKPVNLGLCAGENPGLTGLISGVSTHSLYTARVLIFAVNPPDIGIRYSFYFTTLFSAAGTILYTKIRSRLSDATLDTPCKQILLNGWISVHGV